MKLPPARPRTAVAAVLCAAVIGLTSAAQAASAAQAGGARASGGGAAAAAVQAARPAAAAAGRRLPRLLYAPYFETWTKERISAIASRSGARYFTLAFLQTPRRGSCALAWNGDRRQEIKPGGRYVSDIAALRAMGGNVIPSFGGFSADQGGTEIADSCKSVEEIAEAYESVVTTYGVTRLDMDVEANSLGNRAGIARRSQAMRLLQVWAARHHRTVQIVLTLGVEPFGLPQNCLAVLRSAVAHGVRVTAVNSMAFDYYNSNSKKPSDMGAEAISALNGVHAQLAKLYAGASARRLWHMEGITLLPGIDDFPGKTEVTHVGDTREVLRFSRAHRLSLIAIWAIQRDNGGCPGVIDSNSCSGIRQFRFSFSHLLESYRGR
jgi:Glycosyl hydrolases family 18